MMILKHGSLVLGLMLASPLLAQEGPAFDFAAIDADGDGQITTVEMEAFHAARRAGADLDKDGFLSADELKAQMMQHVEARIDEMVARRIERQDKNGDGKIGADEAGPGDKGAKFFARADENGDGMLSKAEAEAIKERMGDKMRGRHGKGSHGGGMGWLFWEGAEE